MITGHIDWTRGNSYIALQIRPRTGLDLLAQDFQYTNLLDSDFGTSASMFGGQAEAERSLFGLIVSPFEPLTPGSGGGVLLGKKEKLAKAIGERVSEEDLERLRHELASRPTPASATEHTSTRAAGSRRRSSSTSTA